MDKYALYSFQFVDALREGQQPSEEEQRKVVLNTLFGEKAGAFGMRRTDKNGKVFIYPCTVMSRSKLFVLLRLEKPKQLKVFEKGEKVPGEITPIDEKPVTSSPYIYIIFDFRSGCKRRIAIRTNSSPWRDPDKVGEIIEESINSRLELQSEADFRIRIKPEILQINFIEHSRKLIKRDKLHVTKFTFFFSRGIINPRMEEIIKKDDFLKNLRNNMLKAKSAEVKLDNPDSNAIADERTQLLEHLVGLISSEPDNPDEPFRLKMSYSDGSTYSCGKDVRMEFPMDELQFFALLGNTNVQKEYGIDTWFDEVDKKIESKRNAQ